MSSPNPDGEEWLLILSCWPNDARGFARPVLERFDDRDKAEDIRHEYANNDALRPSDYTVTRRNDLDKLSFDVSFDNCDNQHANSDSISGSGS
jgi:hypothetical protein